MGASAIRKSFNKGSYLFMQGDMADMMFLIKGGRVKLTKIMEDGTEVTLDIRKAGDVLGENIFTSETEYSINAQSLEDTVICGFTRSSIESIIVGHPGVGLQIIRNMSAQISWLTSQVENMSISNIEERLYRMLLNVAKEHGSKTDKGLVIPFSLTHEELSFLIGAHRVSVTRAMKSLKESGKIISQGKKMLLSSELI